MRTSKITSVRRLRFRFMQSYHTVMVLLALLLLTAACTAPNPQQQYPLFQQVDHGELPTTGKTFGATWADIDQDGRLDFLIGHHGHGVGLYLDGPGLHFVRQDSCAFLPCQDIDQHGTAACDFDDDGDWDLYVTVGADRGRGTGPNEMWTRNEEGLYLDALPSGHLLADGPGRGRGATWVRLDDDRYPELLVLNFKSPPRLFHFDGRTWDDRSAALNPYPAGIPERANRPAGRGLWFTVGVPADWDRDGRTDLLLAGDGCFVLHNDQSTGLTNVTATSGLTYEHGGVTDAVAGDVDNDGDPDLLLVYRKVTGPVLWLNESTPGQVRFRRGPDLSHLPLAPELDSALLADLDNDGNLDLYVMLQDQEWHNLPNLVARGLGNGGFADVSDQWGGRGAVEALPRGAWPVDLDRDGDLDLMLVHGKEDFPERTGLAVLYENTTVKPGLTLTLRAAAGVPHGLGAEVVLRTRAGEQTRQVQSVTNHWNSTILPVHFGLADDPGPYVVTVRWPDGQRQQIKLPRGGVAYSLTQGQNTPKTVIDIPSQ